ncbi:ubiquinone biosynthesis protein UbiJ [Erwinia pyrifoliae]|uniref:Ubiquinone biosynthesis accessory factor UbiJ n=1 Tax=Erwinia pyrifoliae TaxID=79967 RepID=A0ABY5X986_ERWPY|nr:SCP2 domain-containing protein [Erwinia pyrifoliae]AUX74158.1 SCP2 domain-containing protein [Erwinia pyrifoliae]MCA8875493.1 SCP2 domain-containing protein [Erwinia pyrifoliae]MCT2385215.1 SCP2 domain-containing protein [Erwinia pyrifoliae]MCU8585561.1 SCP2 domain-containing protein [Erwinia pyrifoliae]UWS33864.1 SCP2 domain-containing protein [Erwinia pyrifoliae]
MTLMPLLTASLETALNRVLYRDRGLKLARQRLNGRSLAIVLAELKQPVTFIFSEQQVDVIGHWSDIPDCTVKTRLATLPKLRDRQQLTTLIRSGELEVEGDLQLVQQFSALLDLAELDPAEYLSPWVGDIAAQGMTRFFLRGFHAVRRDVQRKQGYLAQTLTEEWRLAPGPLELAWFAEEVDALSRSLNALDARINRLEKK